MTVPVLRWEVLVGGAGPCLLPSEGPCLPLGSPSCPFPSCCPPGAVTFSLLQGCQSQGGAWRRQRLTKSP